MTASTHEKASTPARAPRKRHKPSTRGRATGPRLHGPPIASEDDRPADHSRPPIDDPNRLTQAQWRCLKAVDDFIAGMGFPPTVAELADMLKLKSKNGVAECLARLEEKGWLERLALKSRAIRIVRRPP
jgi:hypothetical protein